MQHGSKSRHESIISGGIWQWDEWESAFSLFINLIRL